MTLTYVVVDTETTGMDPQEDRLVEVAAVREDESYAHSLVCPGERNISFGAMATHHITQEMVADAPSAAEALAEIGLGLPEIPCEDCNGTGIPPEDPEGYCSHCDGSGLTGFDKPAVDVLVFHNAEFDRGFLPEWLRELPYICTWRCALHLYPNAESHKNGALWYELGLSHPMPEEAGRMPHRALFDAIMTSDILEWMLSHVSFDSVGNVLLSPDEAVRYLVELTSTPVLLTKCPFGMHRGTLWEDVPSKYMEWVLTQDFDEDTKHTCRHWLRERGRIR